MSHCSQTFSVDIQEKITFEEICEQIHKKWEIQNNDKKEIMDSNIDLLRKFQFRNMFLNILLV